MNKKLNFSLFIILTMVLIVSCAPKLAPPLVVEEPKVAVPEEIPATGEASVDEVATDISDAGTTDDELDTSGLDEVDNILLDIETI